MYQSKESERPGVSSESEGEDGSTEGKDGCVPVKARLACTKCAFDSGTSQSGRDAGTSVYSCKEGLNC